jgi:glycine/D-amino acid oxidase-like deaminating enzyme
LLGGGSGHGFKHGPALGELVANTFVGNATPSDILRRSLK